MPKQQSSLDSFFGTGSNKVKKQKTLTSFFNNSNNNKNNKENSENNDEDEVGHDDELKTATQPAPEEAKKQQRKQKPPVNSKRRAIVDDDSSDEEDVAEEATPAAPADAAVAAMAVETTEEKDEQAPSTTTASPEEPRPQPTAVASTTNNPKAEPKARESESKSATSVKPETSSEEDKSMMDRDAVDESTTTSPTIQRSPELQELVDRAKKLAKQAKVLSSDELLPISTRDSTKSVCGTAATGTTTTGILYHELVHILEQIEAISGRLEIQKILTHFFRRLLQHAPEELYHVVYLASNSIAPAYECVELGIGDSILMKAIAQACGTKASTVKEKYEEEGDLGSVAKTFKSKQRTLAFGIKPKPLTVQHVLKTFREIAKIAGSQSQKLKVQLIQKMLVAAQLPAETKYIVRGLQGKLRIGLAQSTVLIALAHALTFTLPASVTVATSVAVTVAPLPEKSKSTDDGDGGDDNEVLEEGDVNIQVYRDDSAPFEKRVEAAVHMVKQVYSEVPSYDALLDAALKVPLENLHEACSFQPGIPVVPMLAKPTKSIQEVLKRLNGLAFTCEYKYDGERAQIHKTASGELKVFSRNLLETTGKYPEVPLFVQEAAAASKISGDGGTNDDNDVEVESYVLDAEVVAYNPQTQKLVPFQVLSTRKKTEESAATAKVQVIVQAFDLMYLNGKSLLTSRLEDRRALMKKHFVPVQGKFQYAQALDFVEDGDTTALEQFLDAAVKGQCEGLMVKTMDDVYEPSRRSLNWLKLKKDYLDGLGDSFDLVPLGAYYGKGKRTGVYGAYLLACYDEEREEFQSVCKIGTGFSDEDLQTLSKALNEHQIPCKSSQYNVSDVLDCDVWFDAVQVWEIKAADLSKSSTHRGALGKMGEADRGIGLRFPRFERIRDDKKPEQATSSDQVVELYYNQDTVKGQEDGEDDDDGI